MGATEAGGAVGSGGAGAALPAEGPLGLRVAEAALLDFAAASEVPVAAGNSRISSTGYVFATLKVTSVCSAVILCAVNLSVFPPPPEGQ